MESSSSQVLAELTQVRDLVMKLSAHLNPSQMEFCRSLAREIVFSIENTISTAKSKRSRSSDEHLHHLFNEKKQQMPKKGMLLHKWTNQVSGSAAGGAELPPDGYYWRKYGQKDIIGAKYPRAYYRCTHRKTQGCPAMKQVQRSYANASVFDVTYIGTHTCSTSRLYKPQHGLFDQKNNCALHQDFQSCLSVKTESSDIQNQDPTTSSSFPSTPIDGRKPEIKSMDFDYVGSFSSALASPCEMSGEGDSELAEIISAANSATDSPILDLEFMFEYGGIGQDALFDTSIFFA